MKAWRVKKLCSDCPFNNSGPGRALRRSLRPARWREILKSLRNEFTFVCHKTSEETGDGSNLLCAGAIAYQEKHAQFMPAYVQVMERMEAMKTNA